MLKITEQERLSHSLNANTWNRKPEIDRCQNDVHLIRILLGGISKEFEFWVFSTLFEDVPVVLLIFV